MSAHQALYPIVTMCRVLGVSPSGYYAWLSREPSARSKSDKELTAVIGKIHQWSRGTYGVPRMVVELDARGHQVNPKRVGSPDARGRPAGRYPPQADQHDAI